MRYAIFSDIHGNLPAWQKVIADIRSLEADVLICLGDVVGYGPKPQEVLDAIRAETDHFVLGNHDAAATGLLDPSIFNDKAHAIVLWTRDHLNQESLEFLANVPLKLATEDLLFVHAEVTEPGRFHYIDNADQAAENFASNDHFATFIGHTHHPLVFEQTPDGTVNTYPDADRSLDPHCRYIINVGSAGEPRNPDDIRARYLIYDDDTREVYFRRIDFDPEVYRDDLASTSLTHTPYFLQVLDHKEHLEATQLRDMQIPAEAVAPVNTSQRKLVFPEQSSFTAKPKPLPLASQKKSSAKPTLTVISVLLLCIGAAYWSLTSRPKATLNTSADSPTSLPTNVFGKQPSHTPPGQMESADNVAAKIVEGKDTLLPQDRRASPKLAPAKMLESKETLPAPDQFVSAKVVPAKMAESKETLPAAEVPASDTSSKPGGVVTNSGMKDMELLYAVNDGKFDFDDAYTTDNSANIDPDSFDRVGYFVELDDDWVWVSMDRFQDDPKLLGVPKTNSDIVENGTEVTNLVIDSNRQDLKKLDRANVTGIIEFWSSNYTPRGSAKVRRYGSSHGHFDWKDSGGTTGHGHGSFQISAFKDSRLTKATILFSITRNGGAGIGNQEPYKHKDVAHLGWISTDWTFGPKGTEDYHKRNLEIWVGSSE